MGHRAARRWVACLALASSSGCAFVFDFPDEVRGVGGGGAGGGAGGAGGGTCPDPETQPAVTRVHWHGLTQQAADYDQVTTTGLVRAPGKVFAFGSATAPLAGLSLASGNELLGFLVELEDDTSVSAAGSVIACDGVDGFSFTGSASWLGGAPVICGAVAASADGPAAYSLTPGSGNLCPGGSFSVDAAPQGSSRNPYVARLDPAAPQGVVFDFWGAVQAPALDVAAAESVPLGNGTNGDVVATIGVTNGNVYDLAGGVTALQYYLTRYTSGLGLLDRSTVALGVAADADGFPGTFEHHSGVAVSDDGSVWMTGLECPSGASCAGTGKLFVGRWAPGSADVTLLGVTGDPTNRRSFGSVVRSSTGRIVVGGGREGSLRISGTDLPPTDVGTDAFVVALDPTTSAVAWAYPPESGPSFPTSEYEAVVDLAVVAEPGCDGGVVYAVGCITDPLQNADCLAPIDVAAQGPPKRGFLVKLDLATGEEIFARELQQNEGDGMVLPTAVAADRTGVWLAADLHGSITLEPPIGMVASSAGIDTLVIQLTP
ncbi:MAG: hypothetical protein JNL21_36585 [Myxococcales bacterium]|nr:hypothetical protein [Myxococcales bacterium]